MRRGTQLFFFFFFFSGIGLGVRPGFPKCVACGLIFASERGGFWTENFQIWRLVNWKFQNLPACELKLSKFGGLWAKIWTKIELVEAKISKFSQRGGSCELTLLLEMGPLRTRGLKRGCAALKTPAPYPYSSDLLLNLCIFVERVIYSCRFKHQSQLWISSDRLYFENQLSCWEKYFYTL